jgi:hypothetical protein
MNEQRDNGQRDESSVPQPVFRGPPPLPPSGTPSPVPPASLGAPPRDPEPLTRVTALTLAEALLKEPARLVQAVERGDAGRVAAALAVLLFVCVAAYGWVLGSFSGGEQAWMAPLKLLATVPFTAAICFPSLYIFGCLGGARQSPGQTAALLLGCLSLAGILMVGFAPISWVFAQSTRSLAFMGAMHTAFWIAAFLFGLRFLSAAHRRLNGGRTGYLKSWGVILLVVFFQVCTMARPLIGPFDGYRLHGKCSFLAHWGRCM